MMSISRWWQLALGAGFGAAIAVYHPATGIMIAIVLGLILAWASLTMEGDDTLTALAAGFLVGILGWELTSLTMLLTWPMV